jgi:DNA-directed RNA polymerase subunit RPC12/RpoP
MAYKFNCVKCGHELLVKWLKPGETAKCHNCGADAKIPVNAAQVKNESVPLPEPGRTVDRQELNTDNCPSCKYLEKIDTVEFDEVLPLGTFGVCHRYPPGVEGRYPFVTPADWCGEYEKNTDNE